MNLTNIDPDKVVAAVVGRWGDLQKIIRPRYFFMQECQLAWERKWGVTFDEIVDGRSHRYIPKAFQTVETFVATALNALMPSPRFFDAVGRTREANDSAYSVKAKLLWDHYRTQFRTDFTHFVKAAAIHGNVPWTYSWKTEKALFPDEEGLALRDEIEAEGLEVEVKDDSGMGYPTIGKTTFEGGKLIVGDIFNFTIDRHPNDPKYAFRVYRTLQTYEYLMATWKDQKDENGDPIYKNLEKLSPGSQNSYETSDAVKRAIDTSRGFVVLPEDKVELLTFCGDLDIPKVGYFHNVMGVIANRRHLVRLTANPFYHGLPPWQMFTLIPDSYDPYGYGTGIVEPNLALFDFFNVRTNQVADANALAIMPPLAVVIDGITDHNQIVWGPMEQIKMRQLGNVKPMEVATQALSLALPEMNFYGAEIATTSGSLSQGGGNASEVQGIMAQVTAVTNGRIKHIQDAGLSQMLRMHLSLNQQNMDPDNPVLVRLEVDSAVGAGLDPATGQLFTPGRHWTEISASDIQGEYDFEMTGAEAVTQANQEFQAQFQFMNAASQDPEFKYYVKRSDWYLECMKKLKFTNAWNYVRTEEEAMGERQREFEQQQAMGQPGAAPTPQGGGSPPRRTGVPSTPGDAGEGGSPARAPYRAQLVGPTSNAGR